MEYNVINSAKDLERLFEALCFVAECAGTQWECQLLEQIQKLTKVNWLKRSETVQFIHSVLDGDLIHNLPCDVFSTWEALIPVAVPRLCLCDQASDYCICMEWFYLQESECKEGFWTWCFSQWEEFVLWSSCEMWKFLWKEIIWHANNGLTCSFGI